MLIDYRATESPPLYRRDRQCIQIYIYRDEILYCVIREHFILFRVCYSKGPCVQDSLVPRYEKSTKEFTILLYTSIYVSIYTTLMMTSTFADYFFANLY